MFGICLGHQILALTLGGKTKKMKLGHRGANHPVKNLINDNVEITSQNHGFEVVKENLPKKIQITHKSLFDNSIEGIKIFSKDDDYIKNQKYNNVSNIENQIWSELFQNLNPLLSKRATANASPIANVAVVLAVGAKSRVQASFSTYVLNNSGGVITYEAGASGSNLHSVTNSLTQPNGTLARLDFIFNLLKNSLSAKTL